MHCKGAAPAAGHAHQPLRRRHALVEERRVEDAATTAAAAGSPIAAVEGVLTGLDREPVGGLLLLLLLLDCGWARLLRRRRRAEGQARCRAARRGGLVAELHHGYCLGGMLEGCFQ